MNQQLEAIIQQVLPRVQPDPEEEKRLSRTVEDLLWRARSVAREFRDEGTPSFDPVVVGSAAKGTWLPGHVDIDLFLMFDPAVDRATLETVGLRAGKQILPRWKLRYAEHPYVHGNYDGYAADIVPAYGVDDASAIQSAVDRTPFHNAYVLAALEVIPERRLDIRLMKAWLRGIGVYGAETARGGLSGYLAEVLVLHHGGFLPSVRAFSEYGAGTRIDPAGTSDAQFPNDPLVVIDPVDPGRNVASAVRGDRLARLIRAARRFLEAPSERFFAPMPLPPLSPERAEMLLAGRGAAVVTFPVPEMREDAIVPHLMRAADSLAKHLSNDGFGIEATDGGVSLDGSRAYLFLMTAEAELEPIRLHLGPPVRVASRANEFRTKYDTHPDVAEPVHEVPGPDGPRLAVRLHQRRRALPERIADILGRGVSLGKHASRALRAGFEVLDVPGAVSTADLGPLLAERLSSVVPWERTGDPAHDYPVPAPVS